MLRGPANPDYCVANAAEPNPYHEPIVYGIPAPALLGKP
jgi:hypothetical protein